ncbi:hypothetical protein L226DRAFT_540421 [Lentinus tigrinus ALCF2SS1-7]|uniref:EF-hand domain-containing protein n=1 Tax=Lentinus tigrinus ALCF2SS1-6 TaxID=1328759 RepID=A0A5C2RTI3_9APHY|nr:hypothetical protein L227DRAFT_581073 [Lentinus tigrinus ALCF2SS1-6]RPD68694.1 hypothetical protein L226DRAFT_540421 [Lentinus tigrinus ALCF2SS1-7]
MEALNEGPYSAVEANVEDKLPLVGRGPGKGKAKGKGKGTRRTLGGIFKNLNPARKQQPSEVASPSAEMDVSEDMPPQDPFDDANAMDMDCDGNVSWQEWHGLSDEDEDAEMALASPRGVEAEADADGDASPRAVVVPRTPQRRRRSSIATTPGSSPRSARVRRSPHTPPSAKKYLTGSGENILHRSRRRRGQDKLASQMKSMQLLGAEAAGAVARGTKTSPNTLRRRFLAVR